MMIPKPLQLGDPWVDRTPFPNWDSGSSLLQQEAGPLHVRRSDDNRFPFVRLRLTCILNVIFGWVSSRVG